MKSLTVKPLLYVFVALLLVIVALGTRSCVQSANARTDAALRDSAENLVARVRTERDAWKGQAETNATNANTCATSLQVLTDEYQRQARDHAQLDAQREAAIAAAQSAERDADRTLKQFTAQFQTEPHGHVWRRPGCPQQRLSDPSRLLIMLTRDEVLRQLSYDPETGIFRWLTRPARKIQIGDVAGCLDGGYIFIGINRRLYRAHRLAWLITHGAWPAGDIDHINGCTADNRICNLRDVPHAVNGQNQRATGRQSASGLLGAHRSGKRWMAKIVNREGRHVFLGRHDTPEAAHQAYLAAKRMLHEGCTL